MESNNKTVAAIELPMVPNMPDLQLRRGKVRMSTVAVRNPTIDMAVIFSIFWPLQTELDFMKNEIVYYGISPYFDVTEEGIAIPQYQIWLQKDEAGVVKFHRIEKVRDTDTMIDEFARIMDYKEAGDCSWKEKLDLLHQDYKKIKNYWLAPMQAMPNEARDANPLKAVHVNNVANGGQTQQLTNEGYAVPDETGKLHWTHTAKDTSPFPPALTIQSVEATAKKYLSEKVLAFEVVLEVSTDDNHPLARPDLQAAYLQVLVKGRKVVDEDIAKFCEIINKLADDDLIEYGVMAPMCVMPLVATKEEKYLIMFMTFSRYNLQYRKEFGSKYFKGWTQEGEMINDAEKQDS